MTKKKTKKQLISQKNKREIFWNVINSLLAGTLVFLGSVIDSTFTWDGILAGVIASAVIAITKFSGYWAKEENEYCSIFAKFI
jgi:hypothetical protein